LEMFTFIKGIFGPLHRWLNKIKCIRCTTISGSGTTLEPAVGEKDDLNFENAFKLSKPKIKQPATLNGSTHIK
jgi:hypothetical protein